MIQEKLHQLIEQAEAESAEAVDVRTEDLRLVNDAITKLKDSNDALLAIVRGLQAAVGGANEHAEIVHQIASLL